jgi:hypothetical protein
MLPNVPSAGGGDNCAALLEASVERQIIHFTLSFRLRDAGRIGGSVHEERDRRIRRPADIGSVAMKVPAVSPFPGETNVVAAIKDGIIGQEYGRRV